MSHVSLNQPCAEADFRDYIACGKCYLPYSSDDPTSIPFWLTECGHVVCNSHINPDQSCSCCGATDIQLAPMQRQMDEPMSEWFRSIPVAMDTIAFAAKFQQEMLAGQIRYYRNRYQQCRNLIEKMKHDMAQLKKANDSLLVENERLKRAVSISSDSGYHSVDYQEPAQYTNTNNKRPMVSTSHQYSRDYAQSTSSSPRSITAPIGPCRITLPAGHQAPKLSSAEKQQRQPSVAPNRPISSRQLQQYAFARPNTSQYNPAPLAKTQAAPRFFQRTGQTQNSNPSPNMAALSSTGTWLKRDDSAQQQTLSSNTRQGLQSNSNGANQQQPSAKFKPSVPANAPQNRSTAGPRQAMDPPPTPRRTGSRMPPPVSGFGPLQAKQPTTASMSTPAVNRRFVPPSSSGNPGQGRSQHASHGNQGGRPMPGMGGSGQRMPFVPGGGN